MSESGIHMRAKKFFQENIPLENEVIVNEREYWIANHRADVYFELKNNCKVAIEYQSSNMSISDMEERLKTYTKYNVHGLVVLNGLGSCVGEKKYPENKKRVSVSKLERFLHDIFGWRVYYFNITEEMIQYPVYYLRFAHCLNYGYKYAHFKRDAIFRGYSELRFEFFTNQEYKLAKFSD